MRIYPVSAVLGLVILLTLSNQPVSRAQMDDAPGRSAPYPLTTETAEPLSFREVLAQSLGNVPVLQANVAARNANVARLEALKSFLPVVTMPQLAFGLRRVEGAGTPAIAFPGIVFSGSTFAGFPGLDHVASNGVDLFFPLDPSGQITALPIAERGIKVKQLMEQLVRRSQLVLAAQHYFEAKQVLYHLRVAELGIRVAEESVSNLQGRMEERQANPIDLRLAQVDLGKARLHLASIVRQQRFTQRELGVVMHRSRLLIPQEQGPFLIEPQQSYQFDLHDPDVVDLGSVPEFPVSREAAIALAKRQRLEVRILIEGVAIARLQQKRNALRLLGLGTLPLAIANRELTGKTSLGLAFGNYYEFPGFDPILWANVRHARLDIVSSELDLEKSLMDAATDAGHTWDKLQLAVEDWRQKELELKMARVLYDQQESRYREKQAIFLEVLGARLNFVQADANRWTSWYNLQLSRLDVLRSTDLLLPYAERLLHGTAELARALADGKSHEGHQWMRK